ncbi:hypothetical protein [Parashewanella tropica]|uniref:hypothetical protein n=1 Tax=Parashewanella tropica TaxID=2547970 RepID=UPI00105A880F|nr:hypothetical protein [Parashewanella tropica]
MKLHHLIAQIITAPNCNYFTVVEVRTAFLALSTDKSLDPDEVRRLVYASLERMVRKGLLQKSVSKGRKIPSYIKTKLFSSDELLSNKQHPAEQITTATNKQIDDLPNQLKKDLFERKEELLILIGEAEEYKRICSDFPELQSDIQPKYNEAREQSNRLLGSIKAIESVIQQGR